MGCWNSWASGGSVVVDFFVKSRFETDVRPTMCFVVCRIEFVLQLFVVSKASFAVHSLCWRELTGDVLVEGYLCGWCLE